MEGNSRGLLEGEGSREESEGWEGAMDREESWEGEDES
jgi:hypothetical protein